MEDMEPIRELTSIDMDLQYLWINCFLILTKMMTDDVLGTQMLVKGIIKCFKQKWFK